MKEIIVCDTTCKKIMKVAKEVGKAFHIQVVDRKKEPVKEKFDLMIVFGGGEQSGIRYSGAEGYVKKIKEGTVKYALVVTLDSCMQNVSMAEGLNVKVTQSALKKIMEEKKMLILGEHICCSSYGLFYLTHPDKRDITKTIKWIDGVRKVIENKREIKAGE